MSSQQLDNYAFRRGALVGFLPFGLARHAGGVKKIHHTIGEPAEKDAAALLFLSAECVNLPTESVAFDISMLAPRAIAQVAEHLGDMGKKDFVEPVASNVPDRLHDQRVVRSLPC